MDFTGDILIITLITLRTIRAIRAIAFFIVRHTGCYQNLSVIISSHKKQNTTSVIPIIIHPSTFSTFSPPTPFKHLFYSTSSAPIPHLFYTFCTPPFQPLHSEPLQAPFKPLHLVPLQGIVHLPNSCPTGVQSL